MTPPPTPAYAQVLRVVVVGWFAAVFALALWAAWSVFGAAAANPECAERDCRRYERVGDWFAVLTGPDLLAASLTFTGVVIAGWAVFALPWVVYAWWLRRKGPTVP